MTTAKELHVKVGDTVQLTDDTTEAIMAGFGVLLGIPLEKMKGRGWVCCETGNNIRFNPLDDEGKPIVSFTWNFKPDEDAFEPVKTE